MKIENLPLIRFASNNQFKISEVTAILKKEGIEVMPLILKIEELQTTATEKLVREKLLEAYRKVGRPVFIEHTGLYLDLIGGLPGGLTQIFWDNLGPSTFSKLFGSNIENSATARTTLAYCDGTKIKIFDGEIQGLIVDEPRGNIDYFQWDCVFQPTGYSTTFAEMGPVEKNKISMRRIALDKFAEYLKKGLRTNE